MYGGDSRRREQPITPHHVGSAACKTCHLPGIENAITTPSVDIRQGKRVRSISGLHEPHGILYLPRPNLLYVANGDDGTLRNFNGSSHPESFRLETHGPKIFVNLPRSRKVAVVDRNTKSVVANWSTGGAFANFPMARSQQITGDWNCRQDLPSDQHVIHDAAIGKILTSGRSLFPLF